GRIRAWSVRRDGTGVRFGLSLPRRRTRAVDVKLGTIRLQIAPGERLTVRCTSATSPLDLRFSASPAVVGDDLLFRSVKLTRISVFAAPRATRRTCETARAH